MSRETLKDMKHGYRIIGYIDTDSEGNKTGRVFTYEIVGWYNKERNVTEDIHYHQIVKGDHVEGLINHRYEELTGFKI